MKLKLAILASAAALCACAPPSPAQQATDFANAEACVSQHWGDPVLQLAQECLGGVEQAAIDIVADIGWILQKAGVVLPAAYASDTRVQASMAKRHPAAAPAPAKSP